ncbi:MAG: C1 family peptidase [Bdellovibrionales bacterium]|nr:C1 family peptidase [Bdellovibrionales bacterium]
MGLNTLITTAKALAFFVITIGFSLAAQAVESKSDLRGMLPYVSKVKSQQGRNTCTVFALTAVLESLYMRDEGASSIDFSEEWLQYLAAGSTASGGAKGSMVSINFNALKRHGVTTEQLMPFTKGTWSDDPAHPQARVIEQYCGDLSGLEYTRCLFGKRSPRYLTMSDNQLRGLPGGRQFSTARQGGSQYQSFVNSLRINVVSNPTTIKHYLAQKTPLTLEVNVHYGSWHHSAGEKYGIDIDKNSYNRGIVTYPERGSVDRYQSDRHPARHAVQVIGYDDDVQVTYTKKMRDGSMRTFTRTGVYYIKNSWGKKFGKNFRFGRSRIPGLGIITQDYAHHLGKFSVVTR